MSSGDVGALARNVIPTTATAVLDLRLVKGNDYQRQVQRLRDHIRKQGFYIVEREPTPEERLKHPLIAKVIHRSRRIQCRTNADGSAYFVGSSRSGPIDLAGSHCQAANIGGSLPLSIITENLRTVTITVPIANYDNNQHAENENIRLQNLWDGIETYAALMTMSD